MKREGEGAGNATTEVEEQAGLPGPSCTPGWRMLGAVEEGKGNEGMAEGRVAVAAIQD
jgi:hypothetical protein